MNSDAGAFEFAVQSGFVPREKGPCAVSSFFLTTALSEMAVEQPFS
jgi:hypothetical protein